MRAILKAGPPILAVESEGEREAVTAWAASVDDHASFDGGGGGGVPHDLGPFDEARRTPIDPVFDRGQPATQPISDPAEAPFTPHGRADASIDGFCQALKSEDAADRARVAALGAGRRGARPRASRIGGASPDEGRSRAVGGPDHDLLMPFACRAKVARHAGARDALPAGGNRPLTPRTRRDSVTVPGTRVADLRVRLRAGRRDGTCDPCRRTRPSEEPESA